ncbi:hypothetical protein J8F10_24010 [Gemmata sp. G18]|uniref:Uncharacterized protein n=1 Tax=Gemmata palustris TaxID=2822762 RepID=A0ABS5BYK2_9BACT|nr:hypothetical protein [Gemmata palustris]MBP3958325.1 hypothetical protein [Gemmata palustris]
MKTSFADRINYAEVRRAKPIEFSFVEECVLCGLVAAGMFHFVTSIPL